MGVLSSLFSPRAQSGFVSRGPIDDYWYEPRGVAAPPSTPDGVLTVATVYRGVSVLANTLAMLPFPVMRELPGDRGFERATDHRLWRTLHDRPNKWQTSFQWRQTGMTHCVLHGNFYCRIVSGPRGGFGEQLIPLDPRSVVVLDQLADGRLVYEYTRRDGTRERLIGGDEVLHIPGLGWDGFQGFSVIDLMRRSLETAVNTESFAARLFSRAPLMRGFLRYPRVLDEAAKRRIQESFRDSASGEKGWHSVQVLENGMEWQAAGVMSADDSQFVQTREHSIPEFARYIGVPTVLLMHADKTALYANAEQFFQSFLNFDIAHWFTNWEQRINQTLLTEDEQAEFKVEFRRQGLLRGDATSRAQFYQIMVGLGAMTPNEVRGLEGFNKLEGLDEPVQLAAPTASRPAQDAGQDEEDEPEATVTSPRLEAMMAAAARSLCRREVAELQKMAKKHAASPDGFRAAVDRLYGELRRAVATNLVVGEDVAEAYCAARRDEVVARGVVVLNAWAEDAGATLVRAAKGES